MKFMKIYIKIYFIYIVFFKIEVHLFRNILKFLTYNFKKKGILYIILLLIQMWLQTSQNIHCE